MEKVRVRDIYISAVHVFTMVSVECVDYLFIIA